MTSVNLYGENLIANSDFESPPISINWTLDGSGISSSTNTSYTGSTSCLLPNPTSSYDGRVILSSKFTVTASTTYHMGGRFYVSEEQGTVSDTNIRLRVEWLDADDSIISIFPSLTGTSLNSFNSWQQLSSTNMTSPTTAVSARIKIDCRETATNDNDVYVDSIYFGTTVDDVVITSLPTIAGAVIQNCNCQLLYGFKLATGTESVTLSNLRVITSGNHLASDLTVMNLYYSQDQYFTSTDTLLASCTPLLSGSIYTFQNFSQGITSNSSGYFFISADMTANATKGKTISINAIDFDNISFSNLVNKTGTSPLPTGGTMTICGLQALFDSFSDGDFSNNTIWSGDTVNFEVLQPATTAQDGNLSPTASNDHCVLKTKASTSNSVLTTASNISYGAWSFSVADGRGWDLSSYNDFSIVLVADTSIKENLTEGSFDFNGYFLKYQGGATDEQFILCRQTGTTTTELIATGYPGTDGTARVDGYKVKVNRASGGEWEVYIDEGFDATAGTTQRGNAITDNTHTISTCFAISTHITNPSEARVLYFDNLIAQPEADITTPAYGLSSTISQESDWKIITWCVDFEECVSHYIVQKMDLNGVTTIIGRVAATGNNANYELFDYESSPGNYTITSVDLNGYTQVFNTTESATPKLQTTIKLNEGWNLISNPFADSSFSPTTITPLFWSWNGINYEQTNSIEAGEGAWVYSESNVELTVEGYEPKQDSIELLEGWNIAGLLHNTVVAETSFKVFKWDNSYQQINFKELIENKGYWIYCEVGQALHFVKR